MFLYYNCLDAFRSHGVKCDELVRQEQEIIESLRLLRAGKKIHHLEKEKIDLLKKIKIEKDRALYDITLNFANKAIKTCTGPVGDIVSDIAFSTTRSYIKKNESAPAAIQEGVLKTAYGEVLKTALVTTTSFAADVGVTALAVANMPIVVATGVTAGALTLASSSSARTSCLRAVSSTLQGAADVVLRGGSKALQLQSKEECIIKAYDAYDRTKEPLVLAKHEMIQYENRKIFITNLYQENLERVQCLKEELKQKGNGWLGWFVQLLTKENKIGRFLIFLCLFISKAFKSEYDSQQAIISKINFVKDSVLSCKRQQEKLDEDIRKKTKLIIDKTKEKKEYKAIYLNVLNS